MNANVVVNTLFLNTARSAFVAITDFTDVAAHVRLVETVFDPKDESTYPVSSTAFPTLAAAGDWEVWFDSSSGRWFLVAPDPVEGWDFVSTDDGVSIVGFVVVAADDDNPIGGSIFSAPIPVASVGEHITLPWVAIDITDALIDALQPYVLP